MIINGQNKSLKSIIEEFNVLGSDLKYDSIKAIKWRKEKAGKDEFNYKFLNFKKVFNNWYVTIRS